MKHPLLTAWLVILGSVQLLPATLYTAVIDNPAAPQTGYFKLGTTRDLSGHELALNSRCLLLDGEPWFPVMGEMHYSRVPAAEWRAELLKMKAGGVDIVATYVFWIHHEEVAGQWDWSGQRDLKAFLQTCQEVGLKAVVRCGPWCHGEVRNGGLPDWVAAHKDWKLRSTDPKFLAAVTNLYGQIAAQLQGQLWKEGGPVIGVQMDNEYGGSPGYLLALKHIAMGAGIDVPFYIKTGWPAMKTPVPLGELEPLFGAYADGFWERGLTAMNGNSWENFTFKHTRTDTGVGNDTLGHRTSGDTAGTEKYPYLTCEIGGGMPASYHRRMNYDPRDVEAVALCQLGSGSSLMGYYLFHGGQNPAGKLSTLQESQATGYPNDLPVKNYDFNAPLGEYGQINPQYYWLRRLHGFLHDFGGKLAPMPLTLPAAQPAGRQDLSTLRWAVRSDGISGFVFVNNYQRLQSLPAKTNAQFQLQLPGGDLMMPRSPVTIPAEAFFYWPFNLDLGGVTLTYATAQPLGKTERGGVRTVYFAAVPGVPANFVFATASLASPSAKADFENVKPRRAPAIHVQARSGKKIQIVLLSEADSLKLRKTDDGKYAFFEDPSTYAEQPVATTLLQSAGPAREITPGSGSGKVARAPEDAEFTKAATWKIQLPNRLNLSRDPRLRIHYAGDVARVTLNGRLLDDDFYSGRTFEIGLQRYGPEILTGDLRLEILPLRKDAPIFFEPRMQPNFGTNETLCQLQAVEFQTQETFWPAIARVLAHWENIF